MPRWWGSVELEMEPARPGEWSVSMALTAISGCDSVKGSLTRDDDDDKIDDDLNPDLVGFDQISDCFSLIVRAGMSTGGGLLSASSPSAIRNSATLIRDSEHDILSGR